MKTVQQIIDYLRNAGMLGEEEMRALASKGFVHWSDVFSSDAPAAPADLLEPDRDTKVHPESAAIERHDADVGRAPRARKSGQIVRKGPVLDTRGLRVRLRGCFAKFRSELAGLVQLAQRLEEAAGWEEAVLIIRNAEHQKLSDAIGRSLEKRLPSLDVLWTALTSDRYRKVVEEPGLRGPAVGGFRALLAAEDLSDAGRHSKLLQYEEVAKAFNVKDAQRRALMAFEAVFTRRPQLIAKSLQRDCHETAYWAMALVYTARRGEPGRRPAPSRVEHSPRRKPPDEAGWSRAWAAAIAMDAALVKPMLAEIDTDALLCPKAWDPVRWDVQNSN